MLKCFCVANLYWAGWSVVIAGEPSNEKFGTIEHGLMRIELLHYYLGMVKAGGE